ncbi:hypothetical protein LSCM1_01800 [Leishmania martiniquensis]|uniref:Nudix hydrolase domain-containing protein n=1 Tax=Leishmania martiniquensis TaxID=1580590 RepID=A0A836KE58_9TRYP|nr:hypothetical protein LSCM1_01800 [Leishmania martiniquensis]
MDFSPSPAQWEDTAHGGPSTTGLQPQQFSAHMSCTSYPPSNAPAHSTRRTSATANTSSPHPVESSIADNGNECTGKEDSNAGPCYATRGTCATRGARLSVERASMLVIRGKDGYAYRRSVQVFFVNERAQFLLCQPVGKKNASYRQTVQGGSEGEESPQETARREAWEEIGLDLKYATLLCEVRPLDAASGAEKQEQATRNEKGEILSEARRPFRYSSKSWRKVGIRGQELYPLLYLLEQKHVQHLDTSGWKRGVRSEFHSVEWGSLADLVEKAPPTKKAVMASVCRAVAAAAKPFLESQGYPTTMLTHLISD